MTKVLLVIIAGCLLFGSSAVLSALQVLLWVGLAALVLLVVGFLIASAVNEQRRQRRAVDRKRGILWPDDPEYLDWRNRRRRWAGK